MAIAIVIGQHTYNFMFCLASFSSDNVSAEGLNPMKTDMKQLCEM